MGQESGPKGWIMTFHGVEIGWVVTCSNKEKSTVGVVENLMYL